MAAVPFNKPAQVGGEAEAIARALASGHTAGGGPFSKECEAALERMLGVRTLLLTSCTHALELAMHLLRVGPGDEVILPSFTFVSTANAVVLRGARPVFADVDGDGQLDPAQVAALRTPRTRAVMPVHYGGNSCDLDALFAAAAGVPVVEDAAQAIGGTFKGRPLGSFGALAAFSFHETKNVGCGEGGALALRDASLIERAEYFRDKGTNRKRFFEGLVDKYTWIDVGSSPVLSELNAAYLSVQLAAVERINARRRAIWSRYDEGLSRAVEAAGGHVLRGRPENGAGNGNVFAIVLAGGQQRSAFIAHMKAAGIATPFHYVALHRSPMGEPLHDGRPLPQTDRLASCLVRLPLWYGLSDAAADDVIAAALRFFRGR